MVTYTPTSIGGLLVDAALAAVGVAVLEVGERRGRGDRVHVVVAVVVERDVQERVVGEPEHDVADVVRPIGGQLGEDALDPPLVLVRRVGRLHRVPRTHQPLLHAQFLSPTPG